MEAGNEAPKSCECYKNLWHNLILYEDVLRGCWRKLYWSLSHNGWLRMLEVPWLLDICKENHGVKQGPGKTTCIPGTRGVVLQGPWWHHTFRVFDRVARLGVFPVGFWVCFGQVFLCYSPFHPFLIGMFILWRWILEEYNWLVYIFFHSAQLWNGFESQKGLLALSGIDPACLLRLWEFWS